MRVLLCSPYKGIVGGISRWTNHIIKFYAANKESCPDLSLDFYSTDRESKIYANTNVFKRVFLGIKEYIPIIKQFGRTIRLKKYDVVHITTSASFSLLKDILLLRKAKKTGVKTIIHFRFGRIPELYEKKNWEQKLIHKVITVADSVIVIDENSYKVLIDSGYNNIELLPNPLTPEIENIVANSTLVQREKRKILFAGHLVPTKGIFELVQACKEIPDIKLTMIGHVTDETRGKITNTAGNNSWLSIKGELNYEETIREMLSSELFVLPTYTEGFPNVILESMACGCCIVASRVGAIPEMLNDGKEEICGICIEPKNVENIKQAITKFLQDEKFAKNCSQNAKMRVKDNYSMLIVWKRMFNIWDSLSIQ